MLVDLAVSLRPRQWVKNVFVLPALIFSHSLFQPEKAAAVLGLFAAFCLLASSAYLLNDIADRAADRCHPIKRLRPVAEGRLPPRPAAVTAAVLAALGLGLACLINPLTGLVCLAYLLLTLSHA